MNTFDSQGDEENTSKLYGKLCITQRESWQSKMLKASYI